MMKNQRNVVTSLVYSVLKEICGNNDIPAWHLRGEEKIMKTIDMICKVLEIT